jgi:pyrimidine deaminase RibD-like protein
VKTLILSSVLLSLTGCASQCTKACVFGFGPGNSAFEMVANHYDTMDPCQHYGKPDGYKLADFCFSNRGKTVYSVKDVNNKTIYKIQ